MDQELSARLAVMDERQASIESKLDDLLAKLARAEELMAAFSNGAGSRLLTMLGKAGKT